MDVYIKVHFYVQPECRAWSVYKSPVQICGHVKKCTGHLLTLCKDCHGVSIKIENFNHILSLW